MVGFTYVDGSPERAAQMTRKLYDNGLMSFTAGQNPTRIRFLMPVGAVTVRDIDAASAIIRKTILELN
jgi:4-aminobutyrate aminotransferase-like enzyme